MIGVVLDGVEIMGRLLHDYTHLHQNSPLDAGKFMDVQLSTRLRYGRTGQSERLDFKGLILLTEWR